MTHGDASLFGRNDVLDAANRNLRRRKLWYLVGDVLRWSGNAVVWAGFGFTVAWLVMR